MMKSFLKGLVVIMIMILIVVLHEAAHVEVCRDYNGDYSVNYIKGYLVTNCDATLSDEDLVNIRFLNGLNEIITYNLFIFMFLLILVKIY